MNARETPGGAGAVLGMRVLRYSGVQGFSLVLSNVFQLAIVIAVANFLGPAQLARFSLLLFLGGHHDGRLQPALEAGNRAPRLRRRRRRR